MDVSGVSTHVFEFEKTAKNVTCWNRTSDARAVIITLDGCTVCREQNSTVQYCNLCVPLLFLLTRSVGVLPPRCTRLAQTIVGWNLALLAWIVLRLCRNSIIIVVLHRVLSLPRTTTTIKVTYGTRRWFC